LKIKLIVFDLDGTLMDSLEEIKYVFNEVLHKEGLPIKTKAFYKKNIGHGIKFLLRKCMPKNYSGDFNNLLMAIEKSYEMNLNSYNKVFDGVYKVLDLMVEQKLKIAVITNKLHGLALKCIEMHFDSYNIEVIGAGNIFPKKPKPDSTISMMEFFNFKNTETLFIGDSEVDVNTAKNADIKSVGALWGYGSIGELKSAGADYIVENPMDILGIELFNL